MLSERRQKVLSALIEEYLACALPVGSRTLVERYQLGVSSATVRNELSILEDAGYIVQPHTSAGRIPTDAGYRAFVDDLLASGKVQKESSYAEITKELRASATELDTLLEQTSAALSRLTDCLSIVLAPSVISQQVKQLSLISLSEHQILIVIVTKDAQVFNRHFELPDPFDPDELGRIQNLFNKGFAGKILAEMRQSIDSDVVEALKDPLVQILLEEILLCMQENKAYRSHQLGISSLLKKPEFSHSESLLPLVELLEDDTILLRILDDGFSQNDTVIKIGHENNAEELLGVSVVASRYGREDSAGVLAIVGPTRMDYSHVINVVRAARRVLQDR